MAVARTTQTCKAKPCAVRHLDMTVGKIPEASTLVPVEAVREQWAVTLFPVRLVAMVALARLLLLPGRLLLMLVAAAVMVAALPVQVVLVAVAVVALPVRQTLVVVVVVVLPPLLLVVPAS